nr:CMF_HP1_G0006820.mRNA.1.CDS.1 [Saccharomyces cerevisiae]
MSSPDDFETAPAEYVDALDPSMVVVDSGSAAVTAPSDSAAEVKANQNEENTGATAAETTRLIRANGGEVLDSKPRESKENVFIVSPYNHTNLPTYHTITLEVVDSRLQEESHSNGVDNSNSNSDNKDSIRPKTEIISTNTNGATEDSTSEKVMVDAEQQARLQEQAQLLRQHVSSTASITSGGHNDLVQIEQPQKIPPIIIIATSTTKTMIF